TRSLPPGVSSPSWIFFAARLKYVRRHSVLHKLFGGPIEMKKIKFASLPLALATLTLSVLSLSTPLRLASAQDGNGAKLTYPATKRGDVVDNYFGTKVPDPYRWLEDDNSPEVAAW